MDIQKSSPQPLSRTVIGDIADRSGVSVTTVSRVLNGHPDVSPATRQKVMHYVREMGYVSNRQPRTTQSLVGMTIPMFNAFFGKIAQGAHEALGERNAQFVMATTDNRYDTEVKQVQQFLRNNLLGIMFILPQESPAELLELQRRGIPFVVTDPQQPQPLPDEIPVISVDNMAAGKLVTEYLIQLGHRRIGIVAGPLTWGSSIDRLSGYYAALTTRGIPIRPDLITEANWMTEGGYEQTKRLLALPNPPTAIFAFNDGMALGCIYAAQECGLSVPEDISVVGYDDSLDDLPFIRPPLTTIHQPLKEVGRIAIDVLYRIMNDQPLENTHIKLSARLIERASTGPCKER